MRRYWLNRLSVLFVALFGIFAAGAHAQDVSAITGTVTDPSGAAVRGVNVTLENSATGQTYKATTNATGSYTIEQVQPGPGYKITFEVQGFKPEVITDLYMNVSSTRTQDVKLEVGGASQTVEVSAAANNVTLNTTDATVGNNFQVQDLNELPIQDRSNPTALFYLQPGVTLDGAVTGARTDQTYVTVDGLEVNDNATGNFGAIVANAPVDSVQEFRGVTAGQLSNAGPGGGGQFSLVTRRGTNNFHGSIVEYHRDTDLQANDWFNNNNGVPRPPLIRNQFGASIGGPIWKNKAFFFFDWNSRRDTLSNLVERTVPMASFRAGEVSYNNAAGGISTLTPTQVAALDPAGIGFNPALLSVITGRYPAPNDLSGSYGDLVNTAGFRFNAPFPLSLDNYVGTVQYNVTDAQQVWARFTVAKQNSTQQAIQYPGDPETYPFLDNSHAWVVGHTWAIGSKMVNNALFGETFEDYSFPNTYNVTGVNQYNFGGIPSGGTFLSNPYASAINAQGRTYPVPVARDDFSWIKGKHNFAVGAMFKYLNPKSFTFLNYNSPTVGLGGNLSNLSAAQRPDDLATDSTSIARYDSEYTFALGRYASVSSTFNYNAAGNLLPQGSGSSSHYRYYETEIYFGDTWKMTPKLTLSYGVQWQNFSVPYEKNGIESLPSLDFNQLFGARLAQSAAGIGGPGTDCNPAIGTGVPCVSYVLGGKANHARGYFSPQYTNFAPRFAFAWMPDNTGKSVLSGGAGVIYDRTVVNAIQYQASQYSYLFQASATEPFGNGTDVASSLLTDPRFGGFSAPPVGPTPPSALTAPYTPFVDAGSPFGLANGQAFNEGVDKNLKTPYSISFNLGFQHEFPKGLILKTTYVNRLGRRLLGQADANQLVEFPDKASGQLMSQAFGNVTQWLRANPNADPTTVPTQAWFENQMAQGPSGLTPAALGLPSFTSIITQFFGTLASRGDFADTMQALSANGLIADNVGMGSQFSEFTYYTNKGFSSYNGLLVTLHQNTVHGLTYDLNYTWAHSIDNVSVVANAPAIGGYGFICDVVRPRECRGNSDFDASNYLSGNFLYQLPVGRGQTMLSTAPLWLDEIVGGWELSGLPYWHTGNAYFASANAFVAGYANNAPAILTGNIGDLRIRKHKDPSGTVWAYAKNDAPATEDFTGPVGFQIGTRNNLRGPTYFDLDMGLGKSFEVWPEKVKLKFRTDAFNVLNHPSFNPPSSSNPNNTDITESSALFGVISSTASTARVLQVSLRLEF